MALGIEPQFYSRQVTTVTLLATPTVVFAAGSRNRFSHVVVRNSISTSRNHTFRTVGGATIILTVRSVGPNQLVIPGWEVDEDGLEVLTGNATGTQTMVFYYGVGPLGAS